MRLICRSSLSLLIEAKALGGEMAKFTILIGLRVDWATVTISGLIFLRTLNQLLKVVQKMIFKIGLQEQKPGSALFAHLC
jgi:hypothetical protein